MNYAILTRTDNGKTKNILKTKNVKLLRKTSRNILRKIRRINKEMRDIINDWLVPEADLLVQHLNCERNR